ncbi:hypothetical protein IW261DRAFT_1612825 [Armillaria novae-zelandiae]|uniref:AAA-ATPase-like domain-containing protein n=1 Tax=Armillaria novae-zelandiae TaxID=153914 RepID=A0AA39NN09_9AGAR|nr:hypothetical protein IW261DRAFT_1612825 [Armillaria novae-zelandiae]
MSFDVECVLPCDFWPSYRALCRGNTFRDLFEAAKDVHDTECYCQLPLGDHARVLTEKMSHPSLAGSETPPAGSKHVNIDEDVSELSTEGRATVAWFFYSKDSNRCEGSSSDTLFSTSPALPSSVATHVGSEGSSGISSPVKISQGIFKTGCNKSTLPLCSLTSYQDVLSSPGVVWVDKMFCLMELEERADFDNGLVLVHRPAGFGKTSFLAMAEFFHDVKYRDSLVSQSALTSSWIGDFCATHRYTTKLLHADLVLTFDLAMTRVTDFERSLVGYLNTVLKQFLSKYQQELKIPPENMSYYVYDDGVPSLAAVLGLVAHTRRWRVFVCIDNYNAPSLAAKDTPEIDRCLQRFLVGPLSHYLDDFHSGLIMGTGDVPDLSMSTYHQLPSVWASVANDLTDAEMMERTFGFTPDEVHELAREFKVQGVESGLEALSFVSDLDKSYSMREVLEEIRRQCRERETGDAKVIYRILFHADYLVFGR